MNFFPSSVGSPIISQPEPHRRRVQRTTWALALAFALTALAATPAGACPHDPPRSDVPQSARDHICGAWNAAVSRGFNPGTALNETHPWGGGYVRDFDEGYYGRGGIMERGGVGWAFIVGQPYWNTYVTVGGAPGPLGYPQGDHVFGGHVKQGPRENTYMTFVGGVINSWSAGTFATWGAIRDRWERSGHVSGPLGRPLSNEEDTAVGPHHSTRGRYSRFEHGVINHSVFGTFVVLGGILKRYTELGYSASHLGLPKSEEEPWTNGGVRQNFEGGYIYWHPGDVAGHTNDDCPINRGGAPLEIKDSMCGAWNRAGFPSLGHPINEVHRWGNGWVVDFEGGSWGRGGIMQGDGEGFSYVIGQPYWDALVRAGGAPKIGYPTGRREFGGHLNEGLKANRYMTLTEGVINSSAHGTFATYGAIGARWEAMGHVTGPLGLPTSDENDTARVPGRFQRFEGGNLIWNQATGQTWHVYGGILNKYAQLAYSNHPLGLPTSDRKQGPRNEYQEFQGGAINQYGGNAYETHGAIHSRWIASRATDGPLGLPTTDEQDTARSPKGTVGRYNRFEHGVINSSIHGAFVIFGAVLDKYDSMGYSASYLGLPKSEEERWACGKIQWFEGGYIYHEPGAYTVNDRERAPWRPCEGPPRPQPPSRNLCGPAPQLSAGNEIKKDHTSEGRGSSPLDLLTTAKLRGSATLAATAQACENAADPVRLYEVKTATGESLRFDVFGGGWVPADGASANVLSGGLKLGLPSLTSRLALKFPFAQFRSGVQLAKHFGKFNIDASLDMATKTSVGDLRNWVIAKKLPHPWLRAALTADWLYQNATTISKAYGLALDANEIRKWARNLFRQLDAYEGEALPRPTPGPAPVPMSRRTAREARVLVRAARTPLFQGRALTASRRQEHTIYPSDPIATRGTLRARPLRNIGRIKWERLPSDAQKAGAASLLGIRLRARLGYLGSSTSRTRPGRRVRVVAAHLKSRRYVMLTAVGPGYSAERVLRVRSGFAGASVRVPRSVQPGTYYLGIVDFSTATRPSRPVLLAAKTLTVKR